MFDALKLLRRERTRTRPVKGGATRERRLRLVAVHALAEAEDALREAFVARRLRPARSDAP